jgi:hypothetical protein
MTTTLMKRQEFALCFITMSAIFIIFNDEISINLREYSQVVSAESSFTQCPAPAACGDTENVFELQCVQASPARALSQNAYAVVSLMLDVKMDPFVHRQYGFGLEMYVEHLRVLGYLIRSLGNLTCAVDMLLMVTSRPSAKDAQLLHAVGWSFVLVDLIESPSNASKVLQGHRFRGVFTKLHIFNMTSYDGVLFLDTDTIVLNSVRNMFDLYLPEMVRKNTHIAWCVDLAANTANISEKNSGVLLVRPSAALLADMMHSMYHEHFRFDKADQGFLNDYVTRDMELVLPAEQYNCMLPETCFFETKNTSIAHMTLVKPKSTMWGMRCWLNNISNMCSAWTAYRRELEILNKL